MTTIKYIKKNENVSKNHFQKASKKIKLCRESSKLYNIPNFGPTGYERFSSLAFIATPLELATLSAGEVSLRRVAEIDNKNTAYIHRNNQYDFL